MSEKFRWCFEKLMEVEGGFSNDPKDRGGATNWGVTMGTYSSFIGRTATVDDMKTLDKAKAQLIYQKLFWEPLHLEEIKDQRIAYMIFDQAVNRGGRTAIRMMQEALNKNLKITDLLEDGLMGSRTIAIINDQKPELLANWFVERCQLAYAKIVEYNESQSRFLKGWMERTHKLARLFWDNKGEMA